MGTSSTAMSAASLKKISLFNGIAMDPANNMYDVRMTNNESIHDVRKYTEFSFCPIMDEVLSHQNIQAVNAMMPTATYTDTQDVLRDTYNTHVKHNMIDGPHVAQTSQFVLRLNQLAFWVLQERQQLQSMVERARFRDQDAPIRQGPPDTPSGIGYASRRPTMSTWEQTFIQ
jgi:hypothetical protein